MTISVVNKPLSPYEEHMQDEYASDLGLPVEYVPGEPSSSQPTDDPYYSDYLNARYALDHDDMWARYADKQDCQDGTYCPADDTFCRKCFRLALLPF